MTSRRYHRSPCLLLAIFSAGTMGCAALLPAGKVESHAGANVVVFPKKDGRMNDDETWTKSMQLTIEVPTHGDTARIFIHLSPYVTSLAGHLPTDCRVVAILAGPQHGVQAPVDYTPSLDDEHIQATVAVAELAALATNKKLTVELCAQRYVINSNGLRTALSRRPSQN